MKKIIFFCAVFAVLASCTCKLNWRDISLQSEYSFEHYKTEFGKFYKTETEHKMRELIFNQKLKRIHEINSNPKSTWKAAVNHLTDRIPSEIDAIRGYNRDLSFHTHKFTSFNPSKVFLANLPTQVDWRAEGYTTPVKNQGICGSCWAFSVSAVLETHMAIQSKNKDAKEIVSPQELVDCVANPHKCGGTGGCSGATQELGFEYIQNNGISLDSNYPYEAHQRKCRADPKQKVAKITSFVKLPENDYNALMTAVATVGPIAISVAADGWEFYSEGVFNGDCGATINHAVTLEGYGTDQDGNDYWLVRNSWGEQWGESGYIKIAREKSAKDVQCEVDKNPADGSGCEGGPSEITVCGKCGILSDSSYPTDIIFNKP